MRKKYCMLGESLKKEQNNKKKKIYFKNSIHILLFGVVSFQFGAHVLLMHSAGWKYYDIQHITPLT
jgi:hypothetical protein